MVSAIAVIEKTPMAISADDLGIVKVIIYFLNYRCGTFDLLNAFKALI